MDLGVYYRPPLSVEGLAALAREVAGPYATVTRPRRLGAMGGRRRWLRVDGVAVDWIYRDVDRVRKAWQHAQEGRVAWQAQIGHPLGVLDVWYAGEVAVGVVLADPSGELARLRAAAAVFPEALAAALLARLPEARFTLDIARKTVARGDVAYVAGCLFRALGVCAYALHAAARAVGAEREGPHRRGGRGAGRARRIRGRAQACWPGSAARPTSSSAPSTRRPRWWPRSSGPSRPAADPRPTRQPGPMITSSAHKPAKPDRKRAEPTITGAGTPRAGLRASRM